MGRDEGVVVGRDEGVVVGRDEGVVVGRGWWWAETRVVVGRDEFGAVGLCGRSRDEDCESGCGRAVNGWAP